MSKEKNIEYMKVYEKNLERDIKHADEKKARIDMYEKKDKDDLKEVKKIIRDLENDL